ncbi:hypothetical protein [Streptomyces sp. NPDC020681]|uniref:hypothetical protein n=1 Tax=Streptomyces sp. NPDC020681 TaxID=3365083 RepID=UPI0037AD2471
MPDYYDLAEMITTRVRRDDTQHVRIVLAGREFGSWWRELRAGLDPSVHAALSPSGPTQLSALAGGSADQQQLFNAAAQHYARHLNCRTPSVTLTGLEPTTTFAELHAAAAAAAQQALTGPLTIENALLHLFRIEETWWQGNAADMGLTYPLAALQAAITAATLIGADDCAQMARRLHCLPGLATRPVDQLTELALWLHQLYAQRSGQWLDPHLPARLAERYAVRCAATQPALPAALATAALTT